MDSDWRAGRQRSGHRHPGCRRAPPRGPRPHRRDGRTARCLGERVGDRRQAGRRRHVDVVLPAALGLGLVPAADPVDRDRRRPRSDRGAIADRVRARHRRRRDRGRAAHRRARRARDRGAGHPRAWIGRATRPRCPIPRRACAPRPPRRRASPEFGASGSRQAPPTGRRRPGSVAAASATSPGAPRTPARDDRATRRPRDRIRTPARRPGARAPAGRDRRRAT